MIQACGDTIIAMPIYEEKIGLIYISDKAQQAKKARVISVGPEHPYDVKVGDVIRFQGNEGIEIEHDGIKFKSLAAKWVIAKEEE